METSFVVEDQTGVIYVCSLLGWGADYLGALAAPHGHSK